MKMMIKILVFCSALSCFGVSPQTKPVPSGQETVDEKKTAPLEMKVIDIKRAGRYYIGRIVDKHGEYLVGALVKAVGRKGEPPYSSVSRTNGQFHVMAPFGDRYTLVVTMTRYKTIEYEIDPEPEP